MDWLEGVEFWLEMPNTPVAALELQVAANMREQMASSRTLRRLALSTQSTPPASSTTETQAPPMTAEAILQQMRELVLSTEVWEPMPVTPAQWEALQKLPEAPQYLTPAGAPLATSPAQLMINAMIYGMAVMIVEPKPPMTATEVLQLQALWELEKGFMLQKKMVP